MVFFAILPLLLITGLFISYLFVKVLARCWSRDLVNVSFHHTGWFTNNVSPMVPSSYCDRWAKGDIIANMDMSYRLALYHSMASFNPRSKSYSGL
jgi:hypothetical protein